MAANLPTRAPLLDQIMKVATQPRRPPGKGEWRMEVRGWRMDGGGWRNVLPMRTEPIASGT